MTPEELARFPTSETAKRMLSRVSPIYDASYVAKWLFEVMGRELDEARERFETVRLQAFPETADWGLGYWEQRYGMEVDPARPLSLRRQEVLIRRGIRAPMNPARLEALVSAAAGVPASVTERVAPYTFRVTLTGDEAVDYAAVARLILRLKPSHQRMEFFAQMPLTQLGNENRLRLYQFRLPTRFVNRRGNPILLDGRRPLDGTWKLWQAYRGIEFESFAVWGSFRHRLALGGGSLTKDSMYELDGAAALDGARWLNAQREAEAL